MSRPHQLRLSRQDKYKLFSFAKFHGFILQKCKILRDYFANQVVKKSFTTEIEGNLPLKHKKTPCFNLKTKGNLPFIAPALQLPFEHPAGVSYQQRQYVQFVG